MRKVLYILNELADADIDWLVQNGVRKSFTKGSVLIEEGRPIPVLFILLDGQLSVTLKALGGKEIAALKSGEVLGELSFLDSRPPSASVVATTSVTVLAVSRAMLSSKLDADHPFAARFYRALGVFLAARLRKTQQRLGYDGKLNLDETVRHEDEMDADLLGGVALAGARFDWMMRQLRAAPRVEAS
ncbi:MAG: cyclic nucleotide-binding domain-containing protein [Planctomycetes bacterium]|nr:cyclic nucleotide-binding domain-containing protein [Planctomycetota bacterium]MBI3844236.1 cyclic nucleotide-binding domain-containing protein [Planctomycetota bacterium]